MTLSEFLTVIAQISGLLFIVTSMLAMGMSLTMAQILQQVPNNYETDLIFPIIKTAAEVAGNRCHRSRRANRGFDHSTETGRGDLRGCQKTEYY